MMKDELNNLHITNPDGASTENLDAARKLSFDNDNPRAVAEDSSRQFDEWDCSAPEDSSTSKERERRSDENDSFDQSSSEQSEDHSSSSSSSSSSSASSSASSAASSAASTAASAVGGSVGAMAGVVASAVVASVVVVVAFVSMMTINIKLAMAEMTRLIFQVEINGAQEEDFVEPVIALLTSEDGFAVEQEIWQDTAYLTYDGLEPGKEYDLKVYYREKVFFHKSFFTATEKVDYGSIEVSVEGSEAVVLVENINLKAGEYYTLTVMDAEGHVVFVKDSVDTTAEYRFAMATPSALYYTVTVNGAVYAVAETEARPDYDLEHPVWTWEGAGATVSFGSSSGKAPLVLTATVEEETISYPDCDNAGEVRYTASVTYEERTFQDVKTGALEAVGHFYGEWIEATESTCAYAGMEAHYQCPKCGKYFDEDHNEVAEESIMLPKLPHECGDLIPEVAATVQEEGMAAHYVCSECYAYLDEDLNEVDEADLVLPRLEYDADNATWTWGVDETGALDGTATVSFPEIHGREPLTFEALVTRHTRINDTCTTPGVAYYFADTSGHSEVEYRYAESEEFSVGGQGHVYSDLTAEEPPTCEHAGRIAFYQCTRCFAIFDEDYNEITVEELEIPSPGHDWDEGVVTPPTYGAGGYTTYTCRRCGATEVRDETEPLSNPTDVSLSIGQTIEIRPDNFSQGNANQVPFRSSAEHPYVLRGWVEGVDNCLQLYNQGGQKETYYLVFDGLQVVGADWSSLFCVIANSDLDIYITVRGEVRLETCSQVVFNVTRGSGTVNFYVTCEEGSSITSTDTWDGDGASWFANDEDYTVNFYINSDKLNRTGEVIGTLPLEYDYDAPAWTWGVDGSGALDGTATVSFAERHGRDPLVLEASVVIHERTPANCESRAICYYVADTSNHSEVVYVSAESEDFEYGGLGHEYGELIPATPNCEEEGMAAHYVCSVCGKYFDQDKQEVTASDLILAPAGHTYGDSGEDYYTCTVCGHVDEQRYEAYNQHNHDGYEAWTSTTSLPSEAGSYYLTADVVLDGYWTVPNGITNLCLNGYGIRSTNDRVITIDGGTLNLYDCGDTTHYFDVENGKAMGVNSNSGDYSFEGGYITGGEGGDYGDNGWYWGDGGGVLVWSGTFNMYGGTILGNYANKGGGVEVVNATMNMYGGTIMYNSCEEGGSGINLRSVGEAIDEEPQEATFNMYGGSVSYNKGTAIDQCYCYGRRYFNLYGGTISNNEGSGVWVDNVNVEGRSVIEGNTSAGLLVNNATVKGSPVIRNNAQGDLWVQSGYTLAIAGTLGSNRMSVFVQNDGTGVFTNGWSTYMDANPTEYFYALNESYVVVLEGGEAKLTENGGGSQVSEVEGLVAINENILPTNTDHPTADIFPGFLPTTWESISAFSFESSGIAYVIYAFGEDCFYVCEFYDGVCRADEPICDVQTTNQGLEELVYLRGNTFYYTAVQGTVIDGPTPAGTADIVAISADSLPNNDDHVSADTLPNFYPVSWATVRSLNVDVGGTCYVIYAFSLEGDVFFMCEFHDGVCVRDVGDVNNCTYAELQALISGGYSYYYTVAVGQGSGAQAPEIAGLTAITADMLIDADAQQHPTAALFSGFRSASSEAIRNLRFDASGRTYVIYDFVDGGFCVCPFMDGVCEDEDTFTDDGTTNGDLLTMVRDGLFFYYVSSEIQGGQGGGQGGSNVLAKGYMYPIDSTIVVESPVYVRFSNDQSYLINAGEYVVVTPVFQDDMYIFPEQFRGDEYSYNLSIYSSSTASVLGLVCIGGDGTEGDPYVFTVAEGTVIDEPQSGDIDVVRITAEMVPNDNNHPSASLFDGFTPSSADAVRAYTPNHDCYAIINFDEEGFYVVAFRDGAWDANDCHDTETTNAVLLEMIVGGDIFYYTTTTSQGGSSSGGQDSTGGETGLIEITDELIDGWAGDYATSFTAADLPHFEAVEAERAMALVNGTIFTGKAVYIIYAFDGDGVVEYCSYNADGVSKGMTTDIFSHADVVNTLGDVRIFYVGNLGGGQGSSGDGIGAREITLDMLPEDNNIPTPEQFEGFVTRTFEEASAWVAPASGMTFLIYAFEADGFYMCVFENGLCSAAPSFDNSLTNERLRSTIESYGFYYTV